MNSNRLGALLADAAEYNPDHTAVIDPGSGAINYRDLYALAKDIAGNLRSIGVQTGDRIGICTPKSIGAVASIFASLTADACHVPVDPGAPPSRSAFIFSDCAVKAILIHKPLTAALQTELANFGAKISHSIDIPTPDCAGLDLELLSVDCAPVEKEDYQQKLAYILYTSGSTGKPKGVIHSHDTAMGFIDWCSLELQPQQTDRFSSHAPFHFDLSIFDLYVAVKHQATLVLIGEEVGKQPMALASIIAEQKISIWYSTPSILRLLVEYGKLETLDCSALRLILYAGEVFPLKHLQALYQAWPERQYYNLYGPTETNVCTFYQVPTPIPEDASLPRRIGAVCSGDTARVVDPKGVDVAVGEEGELWIEGDSVHLGYWNLPEKNAEAFSRDSANRRWYKTGDLVTDQGGSDFLFLGRRDRMVKRRGFRVELGEIENTLYKHPNITEAALVALPDEDSGVQLRAYVQWSGADSPSILQLKRFASENLLNYMIPDRFIFLDTLPKTSTDKIDYQQLKEMQS
ncbi:MAG: amino acid adenylation domain-containing protein [Halioglobus sp.]